ncbi:MAG: tRNA-dihydrouridine synthase [Candidatus Paceibacterota bacterium]
MPRQGVEKSGAGSALIKDPERAKAIILATKKGAPNLPVSVKTRMGYNTDVLEEWMAHLLEARPAAIIMHLRTRKQMSKVPADWSRMRAMRELVNKLPESERPVLLGNGDVETLSQAGELCEEFGADGTMVGRGIFGKPWFFTVRNHVRHGRIGQPYKPSLKKQLKIMLEHTKLYVKTYGPERKKRKSEPAKLKAKDWLKNFDYMKKHYKAYCSDFDGAKSSALSSWKLKTIVK